MVVPLLTHGTGRTGSTLLLGLLQTSKQVLVEGGYPYENRLVAGVTGAVLDCHGNAEAWLRYPGGELIQQGALLPRSSPYLRPISNDAQDWRAGLLQTWQACAARISECNPGVGFYAEKSVPFVAVALKGAAVDHRNIIRVRDPRDTWCSILEFDRRRGFYGFGRKQGQDEESYLARYIGRVKAVYSPACYEKSASLWLRYEDLVSDASGTKACLEDWLDVELTWSETRAYRQHMTSASIPASVGRWQRDLKPAHREVIEAELQELLKSWGYL